MSSSTPSAVSHFSNGTRASRTASLTVTPEATSTGSVLNASASLMTAALAMALSRRLLPVAPAAPGASTWRSASSAPPSISSASDSSPRSTTQSTSLEGVAKPLMALPKKAGRASLNTLATMSFTQRCAASTRKRTSAPGSSERACSRSQSSPEVSPSRGTSGTPVQLREGSKLTSAASSRMDVQCGRQRFLRSCSSTLADCSLAWCTARARIRPSRILSIAR
mmetsp:Transcript_58136/g.125651  ORF Transcript_58136/g.125651 Transcript_58136/m.125651 type:complete len:223 (+) Transcript_58136:520-1188(+)